MVPRLCALLIALLITEPAVAAEDTAADLLAKADRAAETCNFRAADSFWKRIVERFPDTDEAQLAKSRLEPCTLLYTRPLEIHGPSERRIDVFVLAEGYQRKDQKAFLTQAELTARLFFQVDVFERYQQYFNFFAMHLASVDEDVDVEGKDFDTALGAYRTQFSQGQVAVPSQNVRRYLDMDPRTDGFAVVIVRKGTLGTGGGGVAVVGGGAGNTVVHEWGHAFGMLLDEYTSDVGYQGDAPRGFNISDSDDPQNVPWRHFLDAGVKGVGVVPGGAGRSKGAWRPTAKSCAMASGSSFCVVCREALVASIYGLVSPLDESFPAERTLSFGAGLPPEFRVVPMQVMSGPGLEVEYSLERLSITGVEANGNDTSPRARDSRGPAQMSSFERSQRIRPRWSIPVPSVLPGQPVSSRRVRTSERRIAYEPDLSADDLGPGEYALHARVRDPIDWVLKEDWLGCLTDTVTWRISVTAASPNSEDRSNPELDRDDSEP